MRKKRLLLIGPSRSGKTSLVRALEESSKPLRRTQDTIYSPGTIDTPGSYLENPWMYRHLIALGQEASQLLIVVDQSNCAEIYSPGFAKAFRVPVTGVITKADLNPENENICRRQLKNIGVSEPYFSVSTKDGRGIQELKEHLARLDERSGTAGKEESHEIHH